MVVITKYETVVVFRKCKNTNFQNWYWKYEIGNPARKSIYPRKPDKKAKIDCRNAMRFFVPFSRFSPEKNLQNSGKNIFFAVISNLYTAFYIIIGNF